MTGRVPRVTAERAIVAGTLIGEATGDRVIHRLRSLRPEHFDTPELRAIWSAVITAYDTHADAHPERLTHLVGTKTGQALADLLASDITPSAAVMFAPDLRAHIRDDGFRRSVLAAKDAVDQDQGAEALSILREAVLAREEADAPETDHGAVSDLTTGLRERLLSGKARDERSVLWGIREIDRRGAYLRPGDMMVLAARPGAGKTTLLVQFVYDVLRRDRGPVLFVSLEMMPGSIAEKMAMHRAGSRDPQNHNLTPTERKDLSEAIDWLDAQPLYIPTHVPRQASRFTTWVRRMCKRLNPCLVVIDYLGLLSGDGNSAYEKMSDVSRRVRACAQETAVPFFCIHQMNRAAEREKQRLPVMSDLRDSGQLEQDATQVAFIHHKEESECLLIYRKNRWGGCPMVTLRPDFERHRMVAIYPEPSPANGRPRG